MGFRYIGSKDKLSDIIISEIKSTKKGAKHIIDLMAGTGLFSLALREKGFKCYDLFVSSFKCSLVSGRGSCFQRRKVYKQY